MTIKKGPAMHEKTDSPPPLSLRTPLPTSGRLNPRMVVLAAGVVIVAVALSFLAGVRTSQNAQDEQGYELPLNSSPPPSSVQQLPEDYTAQKQPQPEARLESDVESPPQQPLVDPELVKQWLEEAEAARTSPIFFESLPVHAEETTVAAAPDPTPSDPSSSPFASALQGVEPYLDQPYHQPRSPFEVKAGTVIPAVLVTSVNSDLPGDIVARVTEPVYDTVTGRHVLVPKGALLYGSYGDMVENGHDRALVVWQRLIMPNGRSIELSGMAGVDAQGRAGVSDKVDYHLDRLAGGVVLSTLLSFGGNLARSPDADSDFGDVIGDTVAQEASRVGQRVVERQLNVQPTITIRQGTVINVLVNADIVLSPYGRS